jgi:BirA family biotin operon repressor/biotin-[acetyl-CoA-carboxylase] ligase
MQTEGRGRFGRHWYSPFGENIYYSSRWHFDCDLSRLSGLSLVVSLAILATLHEVGIKDNICVKWPNDILWYDKKLCGNLIEVIAESNGSAEVVIGIGLNVNSSSSQKMVDENSPLPDKPWCSLYDITNSQINRNTLIAGLTIHLDQYLKDFIQHGFASFISKWHQADYLQGKNITVSHLTGSLSGKAMGVNETGQLIMQDETKVTHYLSSGDTSLRADTLL